MGELGHPLVVGIATDVMVLSDGATEVIAAAAVAVANTADVELHSSQFAEDEDMGGAATKEETSAVGWPP